METPERYGALATLLVRINERAIERRETARALFDTTDCEDMTETLLVLRARLVAQTHRHAAEWRAGFTDALDAIEGGVSVAQLRRLFDP